MILKLIESLHEYALHVRFYDQHIYDNLAKENILDKLSNYAIRNNLAVNTVH